MSEHSDWRVPPVLLVLCVGAASQAADAAQAFYVDPDSARAGDGSAARPWACLRAAQWAAINQALSAGNVNVYFSARQADADADQATEAAINPIARTDTTTHRLTLDGMSKYNTHDAAPSWADYRGRSRFRIRARYPIGTGKAKRNHVTVRGFRLIPTFGQGIAYWGGDHVVLEHCEVRAEDPTHGPGIHFGYAAQKPPKRGNGGCTDLTIRHNTVHHVFGEGIYIGGVQGQNLPGHDRVTLEYNTVHDVAVYGGEGDAIDIKDGNRHVVVRGNTLYMTRPGTSRDGIVVGGAALIERNFVYHFGRAGISLGTYWNAYANRVGAVIRNNVIVHCGGNPRYPWDYGLILSGSKTGDQFTNARIYHNTIGLIRTDRAGGSIGIEISPFARNAAVGNNLIFECAGAALRAGEGSLGRHDHTLFFSSQPAVLVLHGRDRYIAADLHRFEAHSLSVDPRLVRTAAPFTARNFAPAPGSPAIDAGSAIVSVEEDLVGKRRPQGKGWDIGAHERAGSPR